MKEDCKHRMPCGRCEKHGAHCDAPEKCEHDWILDDTVVDSFNVTNYYVCSKCGKKESLSLGI